jgi:hypothetical protein
MKGFLLVFFCIISSAVFSQQVVISDPNAVPKQVAPFTGIKVSGGITVYLSQSDNYSLAVSANDTGFINDIKTEVKDNVLKISTAPYHWKKHARNRELRVYASFKTLDYIDASGACAVYVDGTINGNTVLIKLSGASTIEGKVNAGTISFSLSGASVANISGNAENIKIEASGASDIKNYDLKTQHCIAKLTGASDARLTITNSLEVAASGASTLYYNGNPDKKDIDKSGASAVIQKQD